MSDSDEVPDLIASTSEEECSEEEEICWGNEDLVDTWLGKDSKILDEQDTWWRVFCLGPFLYGVNSILPHYWIDALYHAKLLDKDRQQKISYLPWPEWECVDLMDEAIALVQSTLRSRPALVQMLQCVKQLDCNMGGHAQNVECVLQVAMKITHIKNLWSKLLSIEVATGKEKAAKFAVLYALKIYTEHVQDHNFVNHIKTKVKRKLSGKSANELREEGNSHFKAKKMEKAIACYTEAAKIDPFHHFNYGNRAQAYNQLNKYEEALADGRRAVTLKPDFAKGYYRYAVAFMELGRLDPAICIIERGLELCRKAKDVDSNNLEELRSLGVTYKEKRQATGLLTAIPRGLDEKLANLPENNVDLEVKFGLTKPAPPSHRDQSPAASSNSDSEVANGTSERRTRNKRKTRSNACQATNTNNNEKRKEDIVRSGKSATELREEENSHLKASKMEEAIACYTEAANLEDHSPVASSNSDSEVANGTSERRTRNKRKSRSNSCQATNTNNNGKKKEDIVKPAPVATSRELVNGEAIEDLAHRNLLVERRQELQGYLRDGSDSMQKKAERNAMSSYQKALDLLAHSSNSKDLDMDEVDIVTLKYAFGMAAISTGHHKDIMEGIEKFQDIIENHQDLRFPPAYFGMGKAYVNLNRFPEASKYLRSGLTIAQNVTYVHVTWPGSKVLLDESDPNTLVREIEELLDRCKFPPPPDAVCRYHEDLADSRTVIYLSDPDFKGFVKISCHMDCVITFHTDCWKTFKTNYNKQGDKDMLDCECPTPDCSGLVIKIDIIRQDGLHKKEYVSERYAELKETHKSKPSRQKSGEPKQTRKNEKREVRRQKRSHANEERKNQQSSESIKVIMEGTSTSAFVAEVAAAPKVIPNVKDTIVYKKDEPLQRPTGKSRKSKRKEKKTKQLLNVEVNFSDRKEEILLSENMALINDSPEPNTSVAPFSVPTSLQSQVSTFEKSYMGASKPLFKPDEVTENLFSYFVGILSECGPLAVDDQRILQELEVFPLEALDKIKHVGGLAEFLKQSLKFAVIDDVVSLMSDAKAAREYALKRREKFLKEGGPTVTQSAWKTVGKSSSVVDSLSESVRTSVIFPVPSPTISNFTKNPSTSLTETSNVASANSSSFTSSSFPVLSLPTVPPPTFLPSYRTPPVQAPPLVLTPPTLSSTSKPASPALDALDSIDDIPVEEPKAGKSRQLDDLDEFDTISESGSDFNKHSQQTNSKSGKDEDTFSSCLSDASESVKSDFSAEQMPKPLRPLNMIGGLGRSLCPKKNSPKMWDNLESDFNVSWKQSKREENSPSYSLESVGEELYKATDEFVRKLDEKIVSELAESVVEKLYQGKDVTDEERQTSLEQVSADIWKDFEKSANSGKFSDGWATASVGMDHSDKKGKFATDFMKKYYDKIELNESDEYRTSHSLISSSLSDSISETETFLSAPSVSQSWTAETHTSSWEPLFANSSFLPSQTTATSFPQPVSSSDYTLFSSPLWGPDSLSPVIHQSTSLHSFLPNPAASYYQTNSLSSQPQIASMSFTPSMQSPVVLPKAFCINQAVQCSVECRSVSVMTEPYVDLAPELTQVKQERDKSVAVAVEVKIVQDRLMQELKAQQYQVKILEGKLQETLHQHTLEKQQFIEERENLNSQLMQLKDLLNNKTASEKELRAMMTNQEQRAAELARLATEQREKEVCEMQRYHDTAEDLQRKNRATLERAVAAELEVLKSRMKNDKERLTRNKTESTYHAQKLAALIKKHHDERKAVPSQLQSAYDYYTMVSDQMEEGKRKMQAEYDSRMEDIQGGKQLSELSRVKIASPPPIPEHLKSLMTTPGQHQDLGLPAAVDWSHSGKSSLPNLRYPGVTTNGFPALPSSSPTPSQPQAQWAAPSNPAKPRPLSGARAPLALPGRAPLRPLGSTGGGAAMSSFEKLISRLQNQFPSHSRQEFEELVQELRRDRGGSLSGMTMEDILGRIEAKLKKQWQNAQQFASTTPRPLQPPPGLNPSWAFQASSRGRGQLGPASRIQGGQLELFEDEVDPCVICHEEMEGPGSQATVELECSHRFHDECIRKWFQEQSTCPNCRVHTLLADEFPSLK